MKRNLSTLCLFLFCCLIYGQNKDLSVSLVPHVYTQVPLSQSGSALRGVTITNLGDAVLAGEGNLKITIADANYEETISIPALATDEDVVLTPSKPFAPAETGSYTVTYTVELPNDVDAENNVKSASFEVSEKTFATDMVKNMMTDVNPNGMQGYYQGNYGNLYELTSAATIESFSIAFIHGNGDLSLCIYQMIDGELKTLYESEYMTRSIPSAGWGNFAEYEIDPLELQPGTYLFSVNTKGRGLLYDVNRNGVFYVPNTTDNTYMPITNTGALCLRVNVGPPATDLSVDLVPHVYTQVPYSQAGSALRGVTITNSGEAIEAGEANLKITIADTDFEEIISIPALAMDESITLTPSSLFTPNGTGEYTVTYTVELPDEGNTENNEKTATFEVSAGTFATDMVKNMMTDVNPNGMQGYYQGNYGNLYELTSAATIESFSIAFIHGNGDLSLCIYQMVGGELKTLYESEFMTRSIPPGGWGNFAEYAIEPQTLQPGTYLFSVNTKGRGLLYDINRNGVFYAPNTTDNTYIPITNTGALCLRVNMPTTQLNPISNLTMEQDCEAINLSWTIPQPPMPDGFVFFEGFNNGIPSSWKNIDADGDKFRWYTQKLDPLNDFIPFEGYQHAVSDSWVAGKEPLDPDNWLITPPITLTADNLLTYAVCAQDASFPNEHYGVFISTTDTELSSFTQLFHETMQPISPNNGDAKVQGTWYERSIDLTEYAGQTVYIAFRHYETASEFRLDLDAVTIIENTDGKAALSSYYAYPLGYEIYRNDELIDTMEPGNTYTDHGAPVGECEYCVKAIYKDGKSEAVCNTINVTEIEITSELYENFDNGLSSCWSIVAVDDVIGDVKAYWALSDLFSHTYYYYVGYTYPESMDKTFAFFDARSHTKGGATSLVSKQFKPTEAYSRLLFDVEERFEKPTFLSDGIELYVEVSTDNGETWSESAENILTRIPDHNIATCYRTMDFDLSDYADQTIRVRFRAVADGGAFVLFLDNIRLVEEAVAPEITVKAIGQTIKQIPLAHAQVELAGAMVNNIGLPIAADKSTMEISVTPGDFVETQKMPAFASYDSTLIEPLVYKAKEVGVHTITYKATVEDVPSIDVRATETFEVTRSVFAVDNGSLKGGTGKQNAEETDVISVGNVFTFLEEDVVNSFSIAFDNIYTKEFSVSIFEVLEDNELREIYTSGILTKKEGSSWGIMNDYAIQPQTLAAGTYFFAVNQVDYMIFGLGLDDNVTGLMHMRNMSDPNYLAAYTNYGTPMVRVNTSGKEPTAIPTVNSKNDVQVYPTRTSGMLKVKTASQPSVIKVINISGQVMDTYKSNGDSTLTLDYPDGLYLVVIEIAGTVHTQKIILKK